MATVIHETEQLSLELFSNFNINEQITLTDWEITQDIDKIWERVRLIYQKGTDIKSFLKTVDLLDNVTNDRGRLKRIREHLDLNGDFIVSYIQNNLL